MSAEQKARFRQVQLAGLGLVIAAVGLLAHHPALPWVGAAVFLLGAGRYVLIKTLQERTRDL